MKKKITAVALAVCILVVGIVGATMSYFTDTDTKTNTFVMGDVNIKLTETSTADDAHHIYAGTQQSDGSYKYDKILPGQTFSKVPSVKLENNPNPSNDAWVVVSATVPNTFVHDGLFGGISPDARVSKGYVVGDNTTYLFYFQTPLTNAEGSNEKIPFKTVTVNPAFNQNFAGQTFNVEVKAYAIQKEGFGNVESAFNAAFGDVLEGLGNNFVIQDFSTTATVTRDANGKAEEKVVTNPDNTIKVTIPSDAIEDDVTEVNVSITPKENTEASLGAATYVVTPGEGETVAVYDISVTVKTDSGNVALTGDVDIPVSFYVGKNITAVEVYHKGVKINDATYNPATGYVSFTTTNFSPFAVKYKAPAASIGDVGYETLAEAVAAVQYGQTIVLNKDFTSVGISVPSGKNFTLDLNNKTLTFNKPGAGSNGTKTQGFQLLKDSTIVIKNGTINCAAENKDFTWNKESDVKGIAMVIQNYANLTLQNVTVDGTNIAHNGNPGTVRYVLSNNCGNVLYDGCTIIAADGDFAFDSCEYGDYAVPTVTVKNTVVDGDIELSGGSFVDKGGNTFKWNGNADTNWYDASKTEFTLYTPAQLAGLSKLVNEGNTFAGKTVKLAADIDLNNVEWTPIGGNVAAYPGITFGGTFDGQGYTISNMVAIDKTANYSSAGFFGTTCSAKISNVKFDSATVVSNHYAGVVVGYTSSNADKITNCVVTNSTVTSTPELIDGKYDNGDKVGGIIGYATGGCSVTSCSVTNTKITAYRDFGEIVGCGIGVTVSGNTFSGNTVTIDNTHNYKNFTTDVEHNVGGEVGRDK